MKRLMSLMEILLKELGGMMHTCTDRDWKTVVDRVEDEGISFLTITLPTFCEGFQTSLDQGRIVPEVFTAFKKGRNPWLPLFLEGFTEQVFDKTSGILLDIPNPDAIRAVRQFTLFVSKIEIPCSDARNRRAIQKYVECEQKVRETDSRLGDIDYHRFRRVFGLLFGDVCARVDEAIYNLAPSSDVFVERADGTRAESVLHVRPKHGPGATADRLKGNQKWRNSEWTERLEQIMPAGEMLLPSWRYYYLLDGIDFLEPGMERPVRVILVPKTLKTPRIIAIEPTAMQYAQQALATMLVEEIGLSPVSPMIGFDDQIPNQEMAAEGSLTGELATLDLSSASDLVSNQLVIEALARFPHLSAAVQASRSLTADVPGVGVIPLAKFASMGSALTFPLEAMVFLTVTIMGVLDERRTPPDRYRKEILRLRGTVRVYGDDIICPRSSVNSVISYLETYGFEVGLHKSFWTGSFRESCGMEYFQGHDVSIAKCRRPLPSSLRRVDECISAVELRNNLYSRGLWRTAAWLDDRLDVIFKGHYPTVDPTSPVLGKHSFMGFHPENGYDPDLQIPLVRGYEVRETIPENILDGEHALLKCLLKRGDEPLYDGHLERSGRPSAVRLKLRWRQPF